jgi:hypothetical protein
MLALLMECRAGAQVLVQTIEFTQKFSARGNPPVGRCILNGARGVEHLERDVLAFVQNVDDDSQGNIAKSQACHALWAQGR